MKGIYFLLLFVLFAGQAFGIIGTQQKYGQPKEMASQKVHPTALQRFFKTSTYYMYAFVLEKPLRLVR